MQPETKILTNEQVRTKGPLNRTFVQAVELMSWPLLLTMRLLIVRNKLYRNNACRNLKKNGRQARYVIYANHQSKIDPFIITACLPSRAILRLFPFRFFVDNLYIKGPAKIIINSMGGFPAQYEPNKAYGLDCARELLGSKQTVVIFPQARRTRERIAKRGISQLALEPNVYLIPVNIDWKNRWHCQVHVGAPIKGGTRRSPEQLMQYVYELVG